MTDIPIGSPMHRALEQQRDAERAAGLLGWLFSRDESPGHREFVCGAMQTADKGRER